MKVTDHYHDQLEMSNMKNLVIRKTAKTEIGGKWQYRASSITNSC